MRKAAVSLVAMVIMLATFALPTHAGARDFTFAKGTNYEISIDGLPDTVAAGSTITATITLTVFAGVSQSRKVFGTYEYGVVDKDLNAVGFNHRGAASVPVGRTKILRKSFVIPANAPTGEHGVMLSTVLLGENLKVGKFIDVTK
jgi:hypothetical protein